MDRRRTKIYANKNRIAAILTIPPTNMDRIVLLEYFASADNFHVKYFHPRQSPTRYDSAINVHIRHNDVLGNAGGFVQGMSATYL